MKILPVCCVDAVFPHEWNQCAIRSFGFTLLQVGNDRIIKSEEQRVVTEAVNLPPMKGPCTCCNEHRCGILLKDVGGNRRILS
jgi:hypothetical protein